MQPVGDTIDETRAGLRRGAIVGCLPRRRTSLQHDDLVYVGEMYVPGLVGSLAPLLPEEER